MPDLTIDAQLEQLKQEYLSGLPKSVQSIESCWKQLLNKWQPETLETLHRLVHTLTGTSATFGLLSLSETARSLEHQLQGWAASHPPGAAEWQQAYARLCQIKTQAGEAKSQAQAKQSSSPGEVFAPSVQSVRPSQRLGETKTTAPANKRLVFLLEEDEIAAQELTLQISYFGYEVRSFRQIDQLQQGIEEATPAVILVNLTETTTIPDLTQWCKLTPLDSDPKPSDSQNPGGRPFIIFLSTQDDLAARLQAVRAGGDAYFTKPINVNELIDKLDQLIERSQLDPYRVLIVEDDRNLAEFLALTLQQAGMVTHLVTNPLGVLQPLNEFQPDLILTDIYMPSCSGQELAAVIRQQVAYVSIPIVFLSSETDLNKQLAAMSLGGDDFLTKPIQPQHLISSVASRAQRSATLRSYMVRDSLTGLLNHTKLKEQLAIELKRTQRQNSFLAFVMIDIDHFKGVNDTYGHPTGDRVIKSLSRLLQQRLRQTDIIGRYGGEEFAVILTDTDGSRAVQVMDQIRQSFAQVQQRAEDSEFNATFSCGIALSSIYQTVAQISKAADNALYKAKRTGRNRVILDTNLDTGDPMDTAI